MSISTDITVTSSEMKPINSWKDVIPFAGNIVAYKTNSFYLSASQGFVLDKSIQFGYIDDSVFNWDNGEKGFNLTRLLKPNEVPGNCALVNSKLEDISMRLASGNEVNLISKAILANQAEFEYLNEKQPKFLERPRSKL